jgi:hypothetical protein
MTTAKEKKKILDTLGKLSTKATPAPVIQEVMPRTEPKRAGRKSHRMEGVEYVRISPAIPLELKLKMEVAMRTTHKETPTIDTFITEAVRNLLLNGQNNG